jgi:exosome complex RNA-binding protein Csl4
MSKLIKCSGCGAEIPKQLKKCPNCGKRNKKPTKFIVLAVIVLLIVLLTVISTITGNIKKSSSKKVTYTWPSDGIAALLPEPDINYGKITSYSEDYFAIDLYFVSQAKYDDYVNNCKEEGFDIDYRGSDSYYYADDKNGNSLTIFYNSKDSEMDISIRAFVEKADNTDATAETQVSDTSEASENASSDDKNTDSSETKAADSSSSTEAVAAETSSNDSNTDFRAWVDSYEKFMNEYVDFMKSYDATDVNALLKYSQLMTEYAEFIETTDNLNENDYSASDWAYYMAAYSRIIEKLGTIQ